MQVSVIILMMLFSVGYSALSQTINIEGSTRYNTKKGIRVTNIQLASVVGTGVEQYNSSFNYNTVSTGVNIGDNSSSVSYIITITNYSDQDYTLSYEFTSDTNTNIVGEFTSIPTFIPGNNSVSITLTYTRSGGSNNIDESTVLFSFGTYDVTPPVISSVDSNKSDYDTSFNMSVNATDAGVGLHSSAYSFNNGTNYQASNSKSITSAGYYDIKVRDQLLNSAYQKVYVGSRTEYGYQDVTGWSSNYSTTKPSDGFYTSKNQYKVNYTCPSTQTSNYTIEDSWSGSSNATFYSTTSTWNPGGTFTINSISMSHTVNRNTATWNGCPTGYIYALNTSNTWEEFVCNCTFSCNLGAASGTYTQAYAKYGGVSADGSYTHSFKGIINYTLTVNSPGTTGWQDSNTSVPSGCTRTGVNSTRTVYAPPTSWGSVVGWQLSPITQTTSRKQVTRTTIKLIGSTESNKPTITSITSNQNDWAGNLTLTVNATDDSGLNSAAYSFDNGATWQASPSKTYTSSGTVNIKVKDIYDNISSATATIGGRTQYGYYQVTEWNNTYNLLNAPADGYYRSKTQYNVTYTAVTNTKVMYRPAPYICPEGKKDGDWVAMDVCYMEGEGTEWAYQVCQVGWCQETTTNSTGWQDTNTVPSGGTLVSTDTRTVYDGPKTWSGLLGLRTTGAYTKAYNIKPWSQSQVKLNSTNIS